MHRKLVFTPEADRQLSQLESDPAKKVLLAQVLKTLGYLETNLHHPGLCTHEFSSLQGPRGEKVFEAYVQNHCPGAYRIFWYYGPDEIRMETRIPVLSIVALVPHP